MRFRLPTVRSKLTALVATTVVMMLCTLPVLSWLLHKQLIDEVDDRVEGAEKSFAEELSDDLINLKLAAQVLATDTDTMRAIQAHDPKAADDLADLFVAVYPDIDVLIADEKGMLLAQVGCKDPIGDLGAIAIVKGVLEGRDMRGMTLHGCEKPGPHSHPAYVIAAPVKDGGRIIGAIVVCLAIDFAYLDNTSHKLALELAMMGKSPARDLIQKSEHFPLAAIPALGATSTLVEVGDKTLAMAQFTPADLKGEGDLAVIAALDVTDIRRLVRENLLFALGALGFAAVVSVAFGLRLSGIMSTALKRVNDALKKLEQQQYVHIDALKTGDELEDLANGFNLMVDGLKERDKLRTTFGKYMTASVVEHLMSGKVQLGGEMLPVTILFTDIRSFTTISEKMDAQELVALLNEYFTDMVGIIMQEDGVVDKYIGDAIMAVFGAPVPKPEDPVNAVRAAVRMRQSLVKLNVRLAERNLGPLHTGIGIHTGRVVAGNIGSEARMEYTVIGDAVNLASRLESSTKELHVDVLISEDTYELTKEHIVARRVKEIFVKGRAEAVVTYEVLGLVGEEPLVPTKKDEGGAVKETAG